MSLKGILCGWLTVTFFPWLTSLVIFFGVSWSQISTVGWRVLGVNVCSVIMDCSVITSLTLQLTIVIQFWLTLVIIKIETFQVNEIVKITKLFWFFFRCLWTKSVAIMDGQLTSFFTFLKIKQIESFKVVVIFGSQGFGKTLRTIELTKWQFSRFLVIVDILTWPLVETQKEIILGFVITWRGPS